MLKIIIITVVGYLIGGISPSFILAKLNGFNIKEKGSKNCGASNAFLTMGIKVAILVGFIDMLKVCISVLLVYPFCKDVPYFHLIAAFSCTLGHIFPFYLKFKGGKGFACLIICMFFVNPLFGLVTLLVAVICAALSNYIIVATMICTIATSVFVPVYTNFALIPVIYCYLATVTIFVRHIPNVIKIIKGEEFHIIEKKNKN